MEYDADFICVFFLFLYHCPFGRKKRPAIVCSLLMPSRRESETKSSAYF